MEKSIKAILLILIFIAVAFSFRFIGNEFTGQTTRSVQCNFVWPQEVVIEGEIYKCPLNKPYCYNLGVPFGLAECCNWKEGKGYSDCESIRLFYEQEQTPIEILDEPLDSDPITESEEIEQEGYEIQEFCDDPDGVYQPHNKQTGVSSTINGKSIDKCENNYLVEYYCDTNTKEKKSEIYDCKNDREVCYGGACIKAYCEFVWPQKIITSDKIYKCSLPNIPYCNVQEAAKGNLKCCKYTNNVYSDCQDMTSQTEFFDIASCVWTWPQKVKYYGKEYACGYLNNNKAYRPWCNNDKAKQGIAQCCANHSPYRDCINII